MIFLVAFISLSLFILFLVFITILGIKEGISCIREKKNTYAGTCNFIVATLILALTIYIAAFHLPDVIQNLF